MGRKLGKTGKLVVMIVLIFVGVVGGGVGVYFAAIYEPPPKHVVLQKMVRDFIDKVHIHFSSMNESPRLLEDELRWFIYNPPVSIDEGQIQRKYQRGDVRPPGDLQRLYVFDENSVVFLNIPCKNVYPVFDTSLQTSNPDKMINETCPHANHFYFSFHHKADAPKTGTDWKYTCVRCAKVYDIALPLGYKPDEVDYANPETPFHKDISDENGVYGSAHLKGAQEIALKAGVQKDKMGANVLNALQYVWIKPQDLAADDEEKAELQAEWDQTPEGERVPLGFRGQIRYMEVVRLFDEDPRVNRHKEDTKEIVRYDRPSELPADRTPEEQQRKPFGYTVWRTNVIRIYEVDVEYMGGNITLKTWDNPKLLALVEPFHRSAEALKKGEEIAKEREEKLKAARAKKGETKGDKPPEEKKEEPK
ncbi:MAG TPA: hypothetical protein VI643_00590 [Planctomycetota bacterium]|nr:hypothetical protein [Planctomycetota bacterium]